MKNLDKWSVIESYYELYSPVQQQINSFNFVQSFLFNNHIINLRYGYLQQNNSTLDNIEFSYKKVF